MSQNLRRGGACSNLDLRGGAEGTNLRLPGPVRSRTDLSCSCNDDKMNVIFLFIYILFLSFCMITYIAKYICSFCYLKGIRTQIENQKYITSLRVQEKTIHRRHRQHVPTRMVIQSRRFLHVLHLPHRHTLTHLPAYRHLLVIQLVLRVGSILVDHVKTVVVTAAGYSVAVGRRPDCKFIEYRLVFEHLA